MTVNGRLGRPIDLLDVVNERDVRHHVFPPRLHVIGAEIQPVPRSLLSQASVFRNLLDVSPKVTEPITRSASICGQRMLGPTPLRKMPRMITRK